MTHNVYLNKSDWSMMIAWAMATYSQGETRRKEESFEAQLQDAEILIATLRILLAPVMETATNGKKMSEIEKGVRKSQQHVKELISVTNQASIALKSGVDVDLNVILSETHETDIPEYVMPYSKNYEETLKEAGVNVDERKQSIPPILVPENAKTI